MGRGQILKLKVHEIFLYKLALPNEPNLPPDGSLEIFFDFANEFAEMFTFRIMLALC